MSDSFVGRAGLSPNFVVDFVFVNHTVMPQRTSRLFRWVLIQFDSGMPCVTIAYSGTITHKAYALNKRRRSRMRTRYTRQATSRSAVRVLVVDTQRRIVVRPWTRIFISSYETSAGEQTEGSLAVCQLGGSVKRFGRAVPS